MLHYPDLSNFTPQVKQARNQSQIFNRKSISRSTTHRQSLHLIQISWFNCIQYLHMFSNHLKKKIRTILMSSES